MTLHKKNKQHLLILFYPSKSLLLYVCLSHFTCPLRLKLFVVPKNMCTHLKQTQMNFVYFIQFNHNVCFCFVAVVTISFRVFVCLWDEWKKRDEWKFSLWFFFFFFLRLKRRITAFFPAFFQRMPFRLLCTVCDVNTFCVVWN